MHPTTNIEWWLVESILCVLFISVYVFTTFTNLNVETKFWIWCYSPHPWPYFWQVNIYHWSSKHLIQLLHCLQSGMIVNKALEEEWPILVIYKTNWPYKSRALPIIIASQGNSQPSFHPKKLKLNRAISQSLCTCWARPCLRGVSGGQCAASLSPFVI